MIPWDFCLGLAGTGPVWEFGNTHSLALRREREMWRGGNSLYRILFCITFRGLCMSIVCFAVWKGDGKGQEKRTREKGLGSRSRAQDC